MIPRTLWFLWWQGMEAAPPVVTACLRSWRRFNPDWDIRVLDEAAVEALELDWPASGRPGQVAVQALSDIVRIKVLERFGGVWADATVLCRAPLSTWLPIVGSQGFFAFDRPGPDRLLSSWLLVSASGDAVSKAWARLVADYWQAPRTLARMPEEDAAAAAMIQTGAFREGEGGPYPYFWFHYLFARLLDERPEVAEIWRHVPRITANLPHRVQYFGLQTPVGPLFLDFWKANLSPVYKLDWREPVGRGGPVTVLDHVLDEGNC